MTHRAGPAAAHRGDARGACDGGDWLTVLFHCTSVHFDSKKFYLVLVSLLKEISIHIVVT